MEKKKVSIILPVYNGELYLRECLESLVNQTLKDIEIIAIDDNSTDNSFSILKEYKNKYPNLRIYRNNKNIGVGATRNRGISLAKGEYIGFVDNDDYISNTMYQTMYDLASHYKYPDIIETGLVFVKDNEYLNKDMSYALTKGGSLFKGKGKVTQIINLSPSVCNKLFKRELISKEVFLEHCNWEDIAFTTTMGVKAKNILETRNLDYFYRRNIERGRSAINYQKNKDILDIFKVTDRIMNFSYKYKLKNYRESLSMICVASIFKRVEELNYWQISNEKYKKIKYTIYNMVYQRYGNLKNIDLDLFSSMAREDILNDYLSYIKKNFNLTKNNIKKKIKQ